MLGTMFAMTLPLRNRDPWPFCGLLVRFALFALSGSSLDLVSCQRCSLFADHVYTGSFKHDLRRCLRYAAVQAVHRRKDTGVLVDHHLDWQACSALFRASAAARGKILSRFSDFPSVESSSQLRQVVSGSTRTADRLLAASLWDTDMCPGCGSVREDLVHMFQCEAWKPSDPLIHEAAGVADDSRCDSSCFLCLGLIVEPSWVLVRRQYLCERLVVRDFPGLPCFPDRVYVDGSSLDPSLPDATFAGAACAFYQASFRVVSYATAVPGLDQGSDRAEVFALMRAVECLADACVRTFFLHHSLLLSI